MLRISNFGNPERFAKEKRREVSRLYERFAKAASRLKSLLSGYFKHLLHGLIRWDADGFF
jgi:hypothetical protein